MKRKVKENVLMLDGNFCEDEYKSIAKQCEGREYIIYPKYRYILLGKRDINNEDFTISKGNFERLFLQRFTDKQFKRLLDRMKFNGWLTKGLFQEVQKTGNNVDSISALKCYI
jgi:hypothetical protein